MVPKVGIEPTLLSEQDFESGASNSLSKSSNLTRIRAAIMPKKFRYRNDLSLRRRAEPVQQHNTYTKLETSGQDRTYGLPSPPAPPLRAALRNAIFMA